MKTKIVFTVFVIAMVLSLLANISMIIPLFLGMILFSYLAVDKGFSINQVLVMMKNSLKESTIVIFILMLIGCLTGLWRQSGTIAHFLTLGVSSIPPSVFILACFLLTTVMSYALGTSYGVTATAGVILISIARAGGVNPVVAAGAILSGVYIGDRGSPAASSGNLVASVTHTEMNENVITMLKDTLPAIGICLVVYTTLSFFYPMQEVDTTITSLLESNFNLNYYCLIPALIMIVLPFMKVKIRTAMIISIIASIIICMAVQHNTILESLETMIFGYHSVNPDLDKLLNGGGLVSMLEVSVILLISGTYGQIFKSAGILDEFTAKLSEVSDSIGRVPLIMIIAIMVCCVFCNQTIGIIMQNQLTKELYDDNKELMLDIEDSVVTIAGIVPWCIACSVPLTMLQIGNGALLYACYLYLVPLIHLFRFFLKRKQRA